MPIGITLNLIVGGEPGFDALISSGICCGWCHSIHRKSLFLVVVANLYYYKRVVIKIKVYRILYHNSIHFIQNK